MKIPFINKPLCFGDGTAKLIGMIIICTWRSTILTLQKPKPNLRKPTGSRSLPYDHLVRVFQATFRKKLYADLEALQKDLDKWLKYYINERTHQGKMCCGRTPIETL